MHERIITDQEFITSFSKFGIAARSAISYLLKEKLTEDPKLLVGDISAIILQIMENFYYQTEILIMLLMALKEKKRHPEKSLIAIYNQIFVREGRYGQDSEELLEEIKGFDESKFIMEFGLSDPRSIVDKLDSYRLSELVAKFGSIEQAVNQGMQEVKTLVDNLKTIIAYRIETRDGIKFPFFKLLNKLKHGYQVVEDKNENVLSVLIDVIEENGLKAKFSVIEVLVNEELAIVVADQTKLIAIATERLLNFYQ
ncbi:MAG: hypothetical protein LWX56_04330 [Ignavibacteria bacterium]|nr:hypothetical protein [Ignavibacteria bacterium]